VKHHAIPFSRAKGMTILAKWGLTDVDYGMQNSDYERKYTQFHSTNLEDANAKKSLAVNIRAP